MFLLRIDMGEGFFCCVTMQGNRMMQATILEALHEAKLQRMSPCSPAAGNWTMKNKG